MCILSFQLQAEVQRLEVLKMQSMKSVIEAIRAEIALLWQRCFYSPEQQQAFVPYHDGEYLLYNDKALTQNIYAVVHHKSVGLSACFLSTDDFTEDLLNLHEAEVRTLKKCFEDHRELFEGVTKWQVNWTLYLELDVSTILINLVGKHLKQTYLSVVTHVDVCTSLCFRKRPMTPEGSTTEVETF